jgi:hypothetical protein
MANFRNVVGVGLPEPERHVSFPSAKSDDSIFQVAEEVPKEFSGRRSPSSLPGSSRDHGLSLVKRRRPGKRIVPFHEDVLQVASRPGEGVFPMAFSVSHLEDEGGIPPWRSRPR